MHFEYYTNTFGNNKNNDYFRHFQHFPVYFGLSIRFSILSVRLSRKSKAKKRRLIFGQFLTVENVRVSAIGNSRKSKISGKCMALVATYHLCMCLRSNYLTIFQAIKCSESYIKPGLSKQFTNAFSTWRWICVCLPWLANQPK